MKRFSIIRRIISSEEGLAQIDGENLHSSVK